MRLRLFTRQGIKIGPGESEIAFKMPTCFMKYLQSSYIKSSKRYAVTYISCDPGLILFPALSRKYEDVRRNA